MIRELLQLLTKDDLSQALAKCQEMLELSTSMVQESVKSLRQSDTAEIDIDIRHHEDKVDAFLDVVRRKVMVHLVMGTTIDTGAGLTLIAIVIDVERIGDLSLDIHALAKSHHNRLLAGTLEQRVADIEARALDFLARTSTAFRAGDTGEARRLLPAYAGIADAADALKGELVAVDVGLSPTDTAACALYIHFLERISGHAHNVISTLIEPLLRPSADA